MNSLLPARLVLGALKYKTIKTKILPKIENLVTSLLNRQNLDGPLYHRTKFCSFNLCNAWLLIADYDSLCKLYVLGLANDNNEITEPIYDRFLEKISRSSEGWYKIGLL